MATDRSFSDMLNEYVTDKLMKAELIKRTYFFQVCERDDTWLGGDLIVPFKGAVASSVRFGGLTAASDIAQDIDVRGTVSGYKEVWGSMKFYHTDLMQHGKVSEQNLVNLLDDSMPDHLMHFKNVVSTQILGSTYFATFTGDGQVAGTATVDKVERFEVGQRVVIDDDNSPDVDAYVTAVDVNTDTVTFSATRGGAALDISAFTVAQNARVYHHGSKTLGFATLRSALLSEANGGSATIYGQSKILYPFTQAINVSGAAIGAANILEKLFDAMTTVQKKGRGNPTEFWMSYKHFGSCLKAIEASKGAFNVAPGSAKTSQFGWKTIEIGTVKGTGMKFVAIQEMDDDIIPIMDVSAMKFYSNGFFKKRKNPETGAIFYEDRAETGFSYIVDQCLFGEFVLRHPWKCGIVHSIPNY